MTALEAALTYIAAGWSVVPIPHRQKRPALTDWQALRITTADAPQFFNGAPLNIGVILGAPSGGLTDIDLDTPEAIAAAPFFLERTRTFGRASSRASHWLYVTDLWQTAGKATLAWKEGPKPLLECRVGAAGAQTVFPSSTHPSGEIVAWEDANPVATVDGADLRARCARIAAVALLARHFPTVGGRHEAGLIVGGLLAGCGFDEFAARVFAEALGVAALLPHDKVKDIARAAGDTVRDAAAGRSGLFGFPALAEAFGDKPAAKVALWLDFKGSKGGESPKAAAGAKGEPEADLTPPVTEDDAALEFAALHADRLRFDHTAGRWHEWSGAHWRPESTCLALEWARQLARGLSEAKKATTRTALRKTAFAAGVEKFARGDRRLAVTSDHWDRDLWLLGTPGGTVDLRTGKLRAADPYDAITKLTACAPADRSDCPRWLEFLDEATGGDDALVRFLQQFFGYCLTGSTREHAMIFITGPGGNGKGVLLNTVSHIMADYAKSSAMDTFVECRTDKHPTSIAMLRGARLVTASEIAKGKNWNENLVKSLTGGDKITAHFMRMDNFSFVPEFKLAAIANYKPMLRSVNEALRRRLNIVGFDRVPAAPDVELEAKLRAEAPGILRWMIDGCLDWQANGLLRPHSVVEATKEYFEAQDVLGQFLEEECDVDPGNAYKSAPIGKLFDAWARYTKRAGADPGTKIALSDELKQRGLTPYRTMAERGFTGIRLKPQFSADDDR